MDEKGALRAIRRREESGLVWIMTRYAPYVGTIVQNILGAAMPAPDIEEVTSDVFLALWLSAGKVRPGKLKAYLGAIARNKAKDRLRTLGLEVPLEEDVLYIDCPDPARTLEAKELALFLRQALLDMAQPDREIFLRHYYYYQSVSQIAAEMNMNISTVKTRLRRGREKLRTVLRKGGYVVEDENFRYDG